MEDIFEIVKSNDLKRLKDNLKYFNINARDIDSFSLLHYATINNNIEMVRYLLLNGIDVNAQTNRNESALHLSVLYNFLGIFKVLIKENIDINLKNIEGESAIMLAIKLKREEMAEILLSLGAKTNLKNEKNENILFLAVHSGNLKLVQDTISKDESLLYSKDIYDNTLLHAATKISDYDIVSLLLEKGLLPNELNKDLEPPIFNCARSSNLDIASLLIDKGSLVEFKNKYNETIFDLGTKRFNDFVSFKQYSVKYSNYFKRYPLICAVILNDFVMFDRYLNKVEIYKKDEFNKTALDYANLYRREKMAFEIKKVIGKK